jgi:signal peptidase II
MNKQKLIIGLLVLIIDQVLKGIIETLTKSYVIIDKVLSIKYVTNTGAAFSLFENNIIVLILISLVILVLVYNLSFSFKSNKINNITFGLLYGGILGNLIDRVFYGYVRDFISIYKFPIFNIADIAIVTGIILLIITSIKGELNSKRGDKIENKSRRGNKVKSR